jgi:hypothetical protein
MAAAAVPLRMEAKRALRPRRAPKAAWPTRPKLIAAITDPNVLVRHVARIHKRAAR